MSLKKSYPLVALGELYTAGVSVGGLVIVQLIANTLGYAGYAMAGVFYGFSLLLSSYSPSDLLGKNIGPDVKLDKQFKQSTYAHLVRAGVSLLLMIGGLFLWFIVGVINGLENTFSGVKKPGQVLGELTGNSLLLKVFFIAISHLTFYSFARMTQNLRNAVIAAFGSAVPATTNDDPTKNN